MNQQLGFPSPTETKPPVNSSPSIKELSTLVQGMIQNQHMQSQVNNVVVDRLESLQGQLQKGDAAKLLATVTGAARPSAVYVGNDLVMTRVRSRYLMYVDSNDISLSPSLIMSGDWEPEITKVFQQQIQPGMTVVDIGANVGFYTLVAADAVGPQGRVYAIEADPRNFKILKRNTCINGFDGRVETHHVAAVDTRKDVELYQFEDFYGSHSLFAKNTGKSVTVPGVPMDDIIQGPVDVMKIDTEGAEPLVFEGMVGVITRSPKLKIIMEFAPPMIQGGGTDPAAFLRRIRELGFRPYLITAQSQTVPFDDAKLLAAPLSELFLTRD